MNTQYVYVYLMRPDGDEVLEAVPDHVAHWRRLNLNAYVGGPFQNRTGGLITFQAGGVSPAEQIVATAPFVAADWCWPTGSSVGRRTHQLGEARSQRESANKRSLADDGGASHDRVPHRPPAVTASAALGIHAHLRTSG